MLALWLEVAMSVPVLRPLLLALAVATLLPACEDELYPDDPGMHST